MGDERDGSRSIQEESPAISESVDQDDRMKRLDKMIEEFKKANPDKNPKRNYPGVF